jgi:hypothetical protein
MRVEDYADRTAFIQFDLASLTGAVNSATLFLSVEQLSTPGTFSIHPLLESWSESTITHNNRPTFEATSISTFSVVAGDMGKMIQVDITTLLACWQANPAAAFGLVINNVDGSSVSFRTRETGNGPFVNTTVN